MSEEENNKLAPKLDRVVKELIIIRRVLVIGLCAMILYLACSAIAAFLMSITNRQVIKVDREIHTAK